MNTQQKLEAIRTKCVELLAIAEKRTLGKWIKEKERNNVLLIMSDQGAILCIDSANEQEESDIDFIAACAGPAEAGWKATIAAIDDIIKNNSLQIKGVASGLSVEEERLWKIHVPLAGEILTAWEGIV